MEFSKKGMQNFKMKNNTKRKKLYNDIIANFIEQFNIGVDLSIASEEIDNNMKNYENVTSGSHVISSFWHKEDTSKAKCNTSWTIIYTPTLSNESKLLAKKNKNNFQLKLLPIPYTDPADKTFSMYKIRKSCVSRQEHIIFLKEKWNIYNIEQYFNYITVHYKKPMFTSYTHLTGHAFFPGSADVYFFFKNVYLELLGIRPARNFSYDIDQDYDYHTLMQDDE